MKHNLNTYLPNKISIIKLVHIKYKFLMIKIYRQLLPLNLTDSQELIFYIEAKV